MSHKYIDSNDPNYEDANCLQLVHASEAMISSTNEIVYVTHTSEEVLRAHLGRFARCFTKKFGYGPAYDYLYSPYSEYEGILFVSDNKLIGGCAFHKKNNVPDLWSLSWVWLHPDYRRKGLFKKCWESFLVNHNQVYIEPPLSLEMICLIQKFVVRNNDWEFIKKTKCTIDPEEGVLIQKTPSNMS